VTSSSCVIRPEPSATGFNLISLSECVPGTKVTIKSVSPLRRILGGA
jgi:hypothetical protein